MVLNENRYLTGQTAAQGAKLKRKDEPVDVHDCVGGSAHRFGEHMVEALWNPPAE